MGLGVVGRGVGICVFCVVGAIVVSAVGREVAVTVGSDVGTGVGTTETGARVGMAVGK